MLGNFRDFGEEIREIELFTPPGGAILANLKQTEEIASGGKELGEIVKLGRNTVPNFSFSGMDFGEISDLKVCGLCGGVVRAREMGIVS